MKKVVVGSTNPVKLEATKSAFCKVFPNEEFEFITHKAPSLVADQPFGIEETKLGARNRASNCKENFSEADYFVGHEGGIEIIEEDYWATAWMCVVGIDGKEGFGRASAFRLPPRLVELIKAGKELGQAIDEMTGQENIKQAGGTISLLTNGLVDRAKFYEQAVIFALIPFMQYELY